MEKRNVEELFLLITPPKQIVDYVAFLKGHVRAAIGHGFEDEFSKAHISLCKYQNEHAENLLYEIETRVSVITPFHVYIKDLNYCHQGSNRTIYLEIVHKNPICELFEHIVEQDVSFTPHLTIAKNLEMNDFLKAWQSLKNLSYSQSFRCDHVTVLKRTPRKWKHYIDLPFAA